MNDLLQELTSQANPDRAKQLRRFFKTGEGEYGEGDKFLGLTVPQVRKTVARYKDMSLAQIEKLLASEYHEVRQAALFILVQQFKKGAENLKTSIYQLYVTSAKRGRVNNWDLIDLTAPHIVGGHLFQDSQRQKTLTTFCDSDDLWLQRIAVMATAHFIDRMQYEDTFLLADKLLTHKHDLIHKAVGWMLREIGNRDLPAEEAYLRTRYKNMPRTMLRYATEKFPEAKRQAYLKGNIS